MNSSFSSAPIFFVGDPHGEFAEIKRACAALPVGILIFVGDLDLARPFREELALVLAAGWRLHWILGNHDAERSDFFDHLAGDYPGGDLHCRVIDVRGVRIAGLSGVFRGAVWDGETPALYSTRRDLFRSLRPPERWRKGIPLKHRSTLFPEDFEAMAKLRADVLVCHEAPTSHRHGFRVLDQIAARIGARQIVHGHHHQAYAAMLPNGIAVQGLARRQVWKLQERDNE